jgi:hypothetical protein
MNPEVYARNLEEAKYRIALELGIGLNRQGSNGHLTSRDAGRIGGRMGGKIGGNMVKRMVEYSERQLMMNEWL